MHTNATAPARVPRLLARKRTQQGDNVNYTQGSATRRITLRNNAHLADPVGQLEVLILRLDVLFELLQAVEEPEE